MNDFNIKRTKESIKNVLLKDSGMYEIEAKIVSIQQTSGPTIFTATDGTATMELAGFSAPGARTYPEIKEDDVVKATVVIKEKDGRRKNDIVNIGKITGPLRDTVLKDIESRIIERSRPDAVNFLVRSEALDRLKSRFIAVATEIKKAVIEGRPIIVRHHADTDGYSGGIALQRAIIPLIEAQYGTESDVKWYYFARAPSKAPFYEYADVLRDLSSALKDVEKFGQKEPLIILVDNGSTEEDLLSIRKAKIYNAPIIVIDHHYPGEVANGRVKVDDFVDLHINPYLVGYNNTLTAGMLCVELARFLNSKVQNIDFLAGLAGIADRSSGSEFEQYVEIAKSRGFTVEFLNKIALAVDFEAHYLRFMEGWKLVDDLLGADIEKHEKLINLLTEDIEFKLKEQDKVIKKYLKVEELGNGVIVGILDTSLTTHRGEFPAPGRATGMAHDYLKEKHPGKSVVTVGVGPFFVTMRASDSAVRRGFNLNALVKVLKDEFPYGFVSGGGHEAAGSIKFVEGAQAEIVSSIVSKIRSTG